MDFPPARLQAHPDRLTRILPPKEAMNRGGYWWGLRQ